MRKEKISSVSRGGVEWNVSSMVPSLLFSDIGLNQKPRALRFLMSKSNNGESELVQNILYGKITFKNKVKF
jgi:hypothetical protein